MTYYLGIDGGGTKTKVAVIDQEDNIIYIGTSGPSSIDTVSDAKTLEAIREALESFDTLHQDVVFSAVFAGLGGIVKEHDQDQVETLLKNLKGISRDTIVRARNDMENALYSGLCFDEGISLICGTGMVAFGKDTYGNTHKAGGWSYKEGDAGSAYDLGLQALKSMIRSYDGRYPKTAFAIDVAKAVGLHQPMDIVEIFNRLDRTAIASLAPLVTRHADQKDAFALSIVEHATDELVLAIQAVDCNLTLRDKKLVIVGSLGNAEGIFKKRLHEKIKTKIKDIGIIAPQVDPAVAAAMMAKRLR